jgi:hypothetical protein
VQAVGERVDVEKRKREKQPIGWSELPTSKETDGVGGEVVVGEDGAFGDACGAGGIDECGRGAAIERLAVVERRRVSGEIGEGPNRHGAIEGSHGDESFGFGVGDDVVDFAAAIEDVDGHEDHAEAEAGEVEVDELDVVGEIDAETIAALEAAGMKSGGHTAGAEIEIAEGVESAFEFESGFGRAAVEREIEEVE